MICAIIKLLKKGGKKIMGYPQTHEKVPNFSSYATLIDRLIIEEVKKSQLEVKLEECEYGDKCMLANKITTQKQIIRTLKNDLTDFMVKAWVNGEYVYIDEERTFI